MPTSAEPAQHSPRVFLVRWFSQDETSAINYGIGTDHNPGTVPPAHGERLGAREPQGAAPWFLPVRALRFREPARLDTEPQPQRREDLPPAG